MSSPQENAIKLLSDLKIDLANPVDPFQIAEKLLEKPVVFQDVDGFDGMLLTVDDQSVIIINKLIREEGRARFTCAHEIGHFVLTSHKREGVRCTEDDIAKLDKKKRLEYEANEFASELLIPSKTFREIIDGREPSKELIEELSGRFGTTLTATAWKYVTLCELSCALVISKDSKKVWCAKSEYFSPYIELDQSVWDGTQAYKFFRGKSVPGEFREVYAELWVGGKGIGDDTKILELSIPQPFYNQVLTILWFEQDLEDLEYESDENYDDEFGGYLKKKWND